MTRRACGFTISNPNELAVKYDTMDSFCLLSSVLVDVAPVREASLHGSDYARIVLVLLEYLEQVDYQRRYRARPGGELRHRPGAVRQAPH